MRKMVLVYLLLVCIAGCQPATARERLYEHEVFTFTIPAGWATKGEVWGSPLEPSDDFYGLGVAEVITIQHPKQKGEGKAFFSVASAPLAAGEELQSRIARTYDNAEPEVKDLTQQAFELAGASGQEIRYRRPWGEPWWLFRDVWLEKDGVVYVLSFHAAPAAFGEYADTQDAILESFAFTD